jgi:hypothetical protein
MPQQLSEKQEKLLQYQMKILTQIDPILNDEDCESFIGIEELSVDDNMTLFVHALATLVPSYVYAKFTGDTDTDNLGFNHIANRLCYQFSTEKLKG